MARQPTAVEMRQLESEHALLVKEKESLSCLVKIVNGEIDPGKRPETVVRAIRTGYPIPLKYTQSWTSLKSVYLWAVKQQDSEMIEWSTRQIISAYGSKAMTQLQAEAKQTSQSVQLEETAREEFLRTYRTMNGQALGAFISKHAASGDDSFWLKQLKRLYTTNQTRCNILEKPFEREPILPHSQTLRASFENEDLIPSSQSNLKPMKLISESNVAGFVSVPMLVEARYRLMDWDGIINHPHLAKKFLIGRVISDEVLASLLKAYGAPEAVWKRICKQ